MEAEPPAKQWLVKGILALRETSAWIATPGAMKSALLAEAAICVGAGLDWHGYRDTGAAGVVYFAIKRAALVKQRLRAHRQQLGLKGTPIAVSSDTIDLTRPEGYKKVMPAIAQQGEIKTAGTLIADAAESLGFKRDARPVEIVGALSERPIAMPEAYRLLRAAALNEEGAANG